MYLILFDSQGLFSQSIESFLGNLLLGELFPATAKKDFRPFGKTAAKIGFLHFFQQEEQIRGKTNNADSRLF